MRNGDYIEFEELLVQYKDAIVNKYIDSKGSLNLLKFAKIKNNTKAQEIITSLKIYDNLENKQKINNQQENVEKRSN